MNSILCIVNPVSGLKKSLKSYHDIEHKIKEVGFSPELLVTEYSGHAMNFLSKIKPNQFNRVFIFGGDGTVNEVINGLIELIKKPEYPSDAISSHFSR